MFINRYRSNILNLIVLVLGFSIGCLFTLNFVNIDYSSCSGEHAAVLFTKKDDFFLIVLILSAPKNIERRNAIRKTWLNLKPNYDIKYSSDTIYIPTYSDSGFLQHESIDEQKNLLLNYKNWIDFTEKSLTQRSSTETTKIRHYFVVGTQGMDSKDLERISNEEDENSDLLLLNDLIDSYQVLTKKLIMSFKEILKNHNFKYVLKCDDDTYVKLDSLAYDLVTYDDELDKKRFDDDFPKPELYWGFFNGRAQIKKGGQWKESHFTICDRYLPYALGGGYVLSKNLVEFISNNSKSLNSFVSEDISVGSWLSNFRNIHRRHDPRFDTAYLPRQCRNYHIVLHKRTAAHMTDIYNGYLCSFEVTDEASVKRPLEYFYDWTKPPTKCCDILVN